MTGFQIPSEFASQLREVKSQDPRSDEEILKALARHVPVTSEKNMWAFWDKGLERMPPWCQRNVIAWVRMCGSGDKPWTIRVLDAIPDSPNYALNFVPSDMLPQAFNNGELVGPYVGPHSADFLRGALLYQHGGAYLDVGCILFRHLDRVCWNELENDDSPYRIAVPVLYDNVIANHFVMARKGDPFIEKWHKIFLHLWRDGRTSHKGIIQDPLLQFALTMDLSDGQEAGLKWDFNIPPHEVFEYIAQVLAWVRLTMLEEAGENFSGSDYWQKHILLFNALKEDWPAEESLGFKGVDIYNTLATSLDADPQSDEYKKAYGLVWKMLTDSTMQKITHGKNLTASKHVGTLWDENDGADNTPGTFAELLRYGATHFEQTREDIRIVETKKAPQTMKKGLLEP